jgi:hypothetical protein
MTDQEIAVMFGTFRARRIQERQELYEYIRDRLASGSAILERDGTIRWTLTGTSHLDTVTGNWEPEHRVFIESACTAEYLADHIINRAYGFGWSIASGL